MRFRTVALALALSLGVTGLVQASKTTQVAGTQRQKARKVKSGKRMKQAKAAHVKARKAKKVKRASR
jgi:hypothetical protein